MRRMEQTAYAKINLSLDVLGKREDGYHIVRMIMQTIDISDDLVFETLDSECSPMEITLATDSGEIPCGEDNLSQTLSGFAANPSRVILPVQKPPDSAE